MKAAVVKKPTPPPDRLAKVVQAGRFVRTKFGKDGRVHVDRPLPFICVHMTSDVPQLAADRLCAAMAAHIIGGSPTETGPVVADFAELMADQFDHFLVIEIHELADDKLLKDDSPFLPSFNVTLASNECAGAPEAAQAFERSLIKRNMRYRTPHVVERKPSKAVHESGLTELPASVALLSIGIAPIYRQPSTDGIYPELLQQLVAHLYDAVLEGVAAFARSATGLQPGSHRSFGRKMVVDAVGRVDRQIDNISSSFDFVLALTPINADAAWQEFRQDQFVKPPTFHYRPLPFDVDNRKKELFSISFDQLEDPTLTELFDEKRRELDLQLTMLNERGTSRLRDASRMMYGSVEPELKSAASEIIASLNSLPAEPGNDGACLDCHELRHHAERTVAAYRTQFPAFEPSIEIRDDIPSGLMVSGPRLLISRSTTIPERRVNAILSHEIGVHLVTYYNGQEQGLSLLRSGLAGYEGMQEGLAVFAEYAVGGLTPLRLRLLAARVIACDAMLAGADFADTYGLLRKDCGLSRAGAFHASMRVHRSGGLAKDAIYLRGLLEVLRHLRRGGNLDLFWIGKIAANHFPIMRELLDRGLLRSVPLVPHFVSDPAGAKRIAAAQGGVTPFELLSR